MASEFAKYTQKIARKKAVLNPRTLEPAEQPLDIQPSVRPSPARKRH